MRGAASESVSAHARYSGYRAPAQYIKHNKNMTNSQKGTTIMKRIISILSVMMALLCVLTLASCADLLSTTKFERGTRTDEAYTNTSAGLAFVKPSGWVFYTDDQLEQTFKVSKDLLKDPDAMDKADVSSLYEFMAVDSSTGNNVGLVVAKGNGVTSVEKYVEQVKKELSDQITDGMTVTFSDGTSNVKLGDGTWGDLLGAGQHERCQYDAVLLRPQGRQVLPADHCHRCVRYRAGGVRENVHRALRRNRNGIINHSACR